jgi:hypothetical protein
MIHHLGRYGEISKYSFLSRLISKNEILSDASKKNPYLQEKLYYFHSHLLKSYDTILIPVYQVVERIDKVFPCFISYSIFYKYLTQGIKHAFKSLNLDAFVNDPLKMPTLENGMPSFFEIRRRATKHMQLKPI